MKHLARLATGLVALALLLALAPNASADQTTTPCLADPTMSRAEAELSPTLAEVELPALTPAPEARGIYFWAWYEEFWKDGEICRWYDSCQNVGSGWCPNGYDYRTNEIFPCYR
jgi:hypothetical protein